MMQGAESKKRPAKAASCSGDVLKPSKQKVKKGTTTGQPTEEGEDVTATVQKYLESQRRPYNAQMIFENLHKAFKKAEIETALESLTEQQAIIGKDVGKQKVYMAHFKEECADDPSMPDLQPIIQDLTQEIQTNEGRLKDRNELLCKTMKRIETSKCVEKLRLDLKASESRFETMSIEMSEKAPTCTDEPPPLSPNSCAKLRTLLGFCHAEWQRRKKHCKRMLVDIAEGTNKSVRAISEELGIEDDPAEIPRPYV